MKIIFTFLFSIIISVSLHANNISVSVPTLTGQNTSAGLNNSANSVLVQFTVSWENSWRVSLTNWDAAWVFIKYRIGNSGQWQHAWLNQTGHTSPAGSTIDAGLLRPDTTFNLISNPGIGAFIYRDANGTGSFSATNVQLRWNYGAQGIADNAQIEVKVFAIEMVYIPRGMFNVGGGNGTNSFISTTISTGNALTVPSGSGSLGGQAGGYPSGQIAPTTSSWPNGYNGFYCMKYEISQQQYVDFLNTLTRTQQSAHVIAITPGIYALTNSANVSNRNSIRCPSTIPSSPTPVTFYCDLNFSGGNNSDASDGQWLACNYISWGNLAGFLSWSGLRPMTELEFEKVCRGPIPAVSGEFAWGDNTILAVSNIINPGTTSESILTPTNANANYLTGGYHAPVRVGIFATSTTDRNKSGASYYGAMEMSGSMWERTITLAHSMGLAFTGLHGNGTLDANGNATILNWPDSQGALFRGGSINDVSSYLQISDRGLQTNIPSGDSNFGGRGVRTAP